jgi:general secretion pathway protein A
MYCNFFGFSEKPFDVTPDPKFLYLTPSHREMLASIKYGIQERRGFITIMGEVGTGKTTMLNAVWEQLEKNIKVAFIFNTDISFKQMLIMILMELGAIESGKNLTKADAVQRLNDFAIDQLSLGGNVVLIVDEAQNLNQCSLENLRLLSNLETSKNKLVQIVLSGQPELDATLRRQELRQLAQRISLRRYAKPLDENESYEYIAHRLKVANYNGPPLFDSSTLRLIWEYSEGIPRKINILCDNALLIGYAEEKKQIEDAIIKEAIRDLSYSPYQENGVEFY